MGNASHRMPSSLRGAAVLPPVPDQSPHEGSQPSLVDVEGFQPSLMDVNATGEVLLEGQVGAAPCLNHNWDCIKWSNQGGCTTNPAYMIKTCSRCIPPPSNCDDHSWDCITMAQSGKCTSDP